MKLVASRELDSHPLDIAYLPNGELVILSSNKEGTFCDAYDADLVHLWSTQLEELTFALDTAADGDLWVFNSAGALALGEDGAYVAHKELGTPKGMYLSAFAQVEDGFIFAWQYPHNTSKLTPRLERVNFDGTLCWSTILPIEPIAYEGLVEASVDEGWKLRPTKPWAPETWVSTSRALTLSGDAVLACFSEMPHSGIGFGYVLSLTDGTLRFTTKKGPISEVASFGGGEFLVGYQGYDAFETLHYECNGRVLKSWESHGYYVVNGNDVRVIELENTLPSKMHLVRLLSEGSVMKGAWLDGYYTSEPFLHADGTLFFFRNGEVLSAQTLLVDERCNICPQDDMLYSTKIVGGEQSLYFVYSQIGAENALSHLVRIDF